MFQLDRIAKDLHVTDLDLASMVGGKEQIELNNVKSVCSHACGKQEEHDTVAALVSHVKGVMAGLPEGLFESPTTLLGGLGGLSEQQRQQAQQINEAFLKVSGVCSSRH